MKNPLITMTAVTGKPTKEKIDSYLKGLFENGIKSVMIYPRSGCEIEYLSDEWFLTVGNFISSARALGMTVWLYDDFNWPSGDAGGAVTKNEQFRLKAITTKGENFGKISTKSRHNSGLFGEKYFPNLLNGEAVDYFISLTHEKYYQHFKNDFGKTVVGIFTDEPSIGYCQEKDSVAYYDGMEEDYKNQFKSDFFEDMKRGDFGFYINAYDLISKKFKSSYLDKINNWCKDHGLLLAGHLMCDNDPSGAQKHSGDFLKSLCSFSVPGVDEIWSNLEEQTTMALLGACEYAKSENGKMAELFALGPSDISYQKRKLIIYLAAAFKINRYFLAISHLDMRGNLKVCDYFNNFNTDQPDFCGMRKLSAEAEIASSLAELDFVPDLYVRYPKEVAIKAIIEEKWLSAFHSLLNELTSKGIQWKIIGEENPKDKPVVELDWEYIPRVNGEVFDASMVSSRAIIKDRFGNDVRGIFVRLFENGQILILNLFAPSGTYQINGKEIYLDTHAVVTSLDSERVKREEISADFSVEYLNDNLIRTMHLNGEEKSEISLNSDTCVTVFKRKGTEISLDGAQVDCFLAADGLSDGLKELYLKSEPIILKKGTHIITAQNDFKYMPTVFLKGDFAYKITSGKISKIELFKREKKYKGGKKLFDFGTVEMKTSQSVPSGALSLEILGTALYTEVYLDGIYQGAKISSPYVFPVDKSTWGKTVELKIVQKSSIAPIFGDTDYWDKNVNSCGWRGTPSLENPPFGLNKLYWNFKEV